MFSTLAFFLTAFLALFVTALPTPGGSPTLSQCNTGPVQCCQSVHQSNSTAGAFLLGAVGVPIQNLVTSVGFDCSPISLGIVGGAMGSGAKWSAFRICSLKMSKLIVRSPVPRNLSAAIKHSLVSIQWPDSPRLLHVCCIAIIVLSYLFSGGLVSNGCDPINIQM